jgi:dihydrofolate reductase
MPATFALISMSLDGYIAGPNDGRDYGLGEGGERLHEWFMNSAGMVDERDAAILAEVRNRAGAVLLGNHMFECGDEPWGDENPWGLPAFVVTHHPREDRIKSDGIPFHFVTDGLEAALVQARAAAGDKDLWVAGGANLIQQLVALGLLDELVMSLVPVLLGDGRPLFSPGSVPTTELVPDQVVASPRVTHLRYRFSTQGES